MRLRSFWITIFGAALVTFALAPPVSACPMCKLANEASSRVPRAYMYSILFMMGMPAMLTTGFGIGFYCLSRKAARMQQEAMEAFSDDALADDDGDPTRSTDLDSPQF